MKLLKRGFYYCPPKHEMPGSRTSGFQKNRRLILRCQYPRRPPWVTHCNNRSMLLPGCLESSYFHWKIWWLNRDLYFHGPLHNKKFKIRKFSQFLKYSCTYNDLRATKNSFSRKPTIPITHRSQKHFKEADIFCHLKLIKPSHYMSLTFKWPWPCLLCKL